MNNIFTRPIIRKPNPKKGNSLWRYMDIHKFLDFVQTQELHFSRLDQMEDPFEGVSTRALRLIAKLQSRAQGDGSLESPHNYEGLRISLENYDIAQYQKSHFINCWFQGDRENMAMWNLYSNHESVAIKVNLGVFVEYFGNENTGWVLNKPYEFDGGNVDYARINPLEESKVSVQKTILKKDECWQHENEYRLFLKNYNPLDDHELFVRVKLDFKVFNFQIVFHPKMEDWKKRNIQRAIKNCEIDIVSKDSDIRLK